MLCLRIETPTKESNRLMDTPNNSAGSGASKPAVSFQAAMDVRGLIDSQGGPVKLAARLAESGLGAISVAGVRKWYLRETMSTNWLVCVLALPALEGEPLDVYKYVKIGPRPRH